MGGLNAAARTVLSTSEKAMTQWKRLKSAKNVGSALQGVEMVKLKLVIPQRRLKASVIGLTDQTSDVLGQRLACEFCVGRVHLT